MRESVTSVERHCVRHTVTQSITETHRHKTVWIAMYMAGTLCRRHQGWRGRPQKSTAEVYSEVVAPQRGHTHLSKNTSIFNALSWSCVTSQHRSSSSTIESMPSSCTNAWSMTTTAAVQLSPLSCLESHFSCRFFCNDEVACQNSRSRSHCWYVYASVGAEKLGGGSCPNRGRTAASSSTLSCHPMVSTHAGLRYQLWIFFHQIDSIVILYRVYTSTHQTKICQRC